MNEYQTCKICGLSKLLTVKFFTQKFNTKNGVKTPYWYSFCKACEKIKNSIYSKSYYENNRDRVLKNKKEYDDKNREEINRKGRENSKNYTKNNKEKVSISKAKYYKNNKQRIRKQQIRRHKERMKTDLNYKLRNRLSFYINIELKNNGSSKSGSSILNFLPYSIQELKEHLENLFEPWMNWDNQGIYKSDDWNNENSETWKWQIDH